jgi:hypothetical protein
LARIQFSRLGQRHQRVALVIAEFRVRTRPHEHGGDIGVGQDFPNRPLQSGLDFFVG